MSVTGRPGGRPPLPRHPQTVLPPVAVLPPSGLCRLLVKVWVAGLLSAFGIGLLRVMWHNMAFTDGAFAGLGLLIGLYVSCVCPALGFYLTHRQVLRARPTSDWAVEIATAVVVLGGAAVIALNTVLVSGETFFPPFGPVTTIVLCSPYPIVFTALTMRRPAALATALATAAIVGPAVLPLRTAQEHLAADAWRSRHPSVSWNLIAAVDWPGAEQSAMKTGPFGTQVTVDFPDTIIDGMPDAVVTVSPAGTDPCRDLPVIATYETMPDDELPGQDEETVTVPDPGCSPAGTNAWELDGTGFRGYAALVNGVLVRITVDDERPDDDLAAVARSLHPLDDHQLWRYSGGWPGWAWLLT